MASNLIAMASSLLATATNLIAMASNLLGMASNLLATATNLIAMASNLLAMASNLTQDLVVMMRIRLWVSGGKQCPRANYSLWSKGALTDQLKLLMSTLSSSFELS